MRALEKLDVSHNALVDLPATLCKLPALTELGVQRNKLSSLPEWIGEMRALEKLAVSHNPLVDLPASLCKLPVAHATVLAAW